MHTKNITDLTALITGASAGIGRATARLLARCGCNLVLLARREPELRKLAEELRSHTNVRVRIAVGDVSDGGTFRGILDNLVQEETIDICVINAGIGQYGPVSHSPWEHIERVLHTNIEGAFATAHAVLPQMCQRKHGSIVFISSALGKRAIPWNAAYCASKHALHGFADALRLEVKRHGIHIGVVLPARTKTEFFDVMTYSVPQTRRRELPESPPEAVAEAILQNILRNRRETVVSAGGKLYGFFGYHFPRTCDFVFSRLIPTPDDDGNQDTYPPHSL